MDELSKYFDNLDNKVLRHNLVLALFDKLDKMDKQVLADNFDMSGRLVLEGVLDSFDTFDKLELDSSDKLVLGDGLDNSDRLVLEDELDSFDTFDKLELEDVLDNSDRLVLLDVLDSFDMFGTLELDKMGIFEGKVF